MAEDIRGRMLSVSILTAGLKYPVSFFFFRLFVEDLEFLPS